MLFKAMIFLTLLSTTVLRYEASTNNFGGVEAIKQLKIATPSNRACRVGEGIVINFKWSLRISRTSDGRCGPAQTTGECEEAGKV